MTDFIRSYGSGFIFTTSMPPTVLASAITAIEVRIDFMRKIFLNEKYNSFIDFQE